MSHAESCQSHTCVEIPVYPYGLPSKLEEASEFLKSRLHAGLQSRVLGSKTDHNFIWPDDIDRVATDLSAADFAELASEASTVIHIGCGGPRVESDEPPNMGKGTLLMYDQNPESQRITFALDVGAHLTGSGPGSKMRISQKFDDKKPETVFEFADGTLDEREYWPYTICTLKLPKGKRFEVSQLLPEKNRD